MIEHQFRYAASSGNDINARVFTKSIAHYFIAFTTPVNNFVAFTGKARIVIKAFICRQSCHLSGGYIGHINSAFQFVRPVYIGNQLSIRTERRLKLKICAISQAFGLAIGQIFYIDITRRIKSYFFAIR